MTNDMFDDFSKGCIPTIVTGVLVGVLLGLGIVVLIVWLNGHISVVIR